MQFLLLFIHFISRKATLNIKYISTLLNPSRSLNHISTFKFNRSSIVISFIHYLKAVPFTLLVCLIGMLKNKNYFINFTSHYVIRGSKYKTRILNQIKFIQIKWFLVFKHFKHNVTIWIKLLIFHVKKCLPSKYEIICRFPKWRTCLTGKSVTKDGWRVRYLKCREPCL